MQTLKRTFFGLILGSLLGISLLGLKLIAMPNFAMAQSAVELTDSTISTGSSDVEATIGSLIQIALGFLGVISVVIILMGGFKWMVSGGNNDNVKEAQTLIFGGVVGLAVIVSAWAITSFVVEAILKAVN
jgi:hypothetical protein